MELFAPAEYDVSKVRISLLLALFLEGMLIALIWEYSATNKSVPTQAVEVQCVHGEIDYGVRTFGIPFCFVVQRKETAATLKVRQRE